MGGALLSFTLMAVAVRGLLPVMGHFEILFLRSATGLLILLPVLMRYGLGPLRTQRIGLHTVRAIFHFGGQYAWVYALAMLPLATVFAIEFTMPVWTALLAVLLLGERLNRSRITMLVTGFAGIFIILKPGVDSIPPAALVMLAGSFCYGAAIIGAKKLAASDTILAILFYMCVVQGPIALFFALPQWVAPQLADLPWIAAMGFAGLASHFCMTRAFRLADATLVVPIDFLRLPLIAAIGALFYGEPLEFSVLLGAAVMFAGTYYSIRRESLQKP
jgi:drug/metabolite transporter (DMT)-like permease